MRGLYRRMQRRGFQRQGAVLLMFALTLVLIFGFMGLAIDVGRLYLARNEAQSFADSAALAAAVMLDGASFTPALNAVAGTYMTASTDKWKTYHFQTKQFTDYTVKFSLTGADGTFAESGSAPAKSRFVEVTATAHVPMSFSALLLGSTGDGTSAARTRAVAGQILKTIWDEGLVPFAPWAHCSTEAVAGFAQCVPSESNPAAYDVNLTPGKTYAFRWEANAFQQSFKDFLSKGGKIDYNGWCDGDMDPGFSNSLGQLYTSTNKTIWDKGRGYWTSGEVHGTSDYRKLLEGSMGSAIDLGTLLSSFDGKEPQEVSALFKDLNDKAALPAPGNTVFAPVVDPVTGAILGFREFILIPGYKSNTTWCAKYVGSAVYGPGTASVDQNGIYEIRLVR